MQQVNAWLKQPYSPNMDVWGWLLFVGLVIVLSLAWLHTVNFLSKAV
jgi:hypothetical protein